MYIPRDDAFPACTSDDVCLPTMAVIGQDPSEQENDPMPAPPSFDRAGPHRFIGIGIVAGLVFIIIVLWLTCASRPRRFFNRRFGHVSGRRVLAESSSSWPVVEKTLEFKHDAVIAKPDKARPKSGKSSRHPEIKFGNEGIQGNYRVKWETQRSDNYEPYRHSDDDQFPICPVRRPPS